MLRPKQIRLKLNKSNFHHCQQLSKELAKVWTLKLLFCFLLTVLLVGLVSSGVNAASFAWDGDVNATDWTDPDNWEYPDGNDPLVYPGESGNTDVVTFDDSLYGSANPINDPANLAFPNGKTVASITIDPVGAAGAYTFTQAAGNTFTITGALTVDAAAAAEDVTITINGTLSAGSFAINGGDDTGADARIDLDDNASVLTASGDIVLTANSGGAIIDATDVSASINVGGALSIGNGATWTKGTGTLTFTGAACTLSDANGTPNNLGNVVVD